MFEEKFFESLLKLIIIGNAPTLALSIFIVSSAYKFEFNINCKIAAKIKYFI